MRVARNVTGAPQKVWSGSAVPGSPSYLTSAVGTETPISAPVEILVFGSAFDRIDESFR